MFDKNHRCFIRVCLSLCPCAVNNLSDFYLRESCILGHGINIFHRKITGINCYHRNTSFACYGFGSMTSSTAIRRTGIEEESHPFCPDSFVFNLIDNTLSLRFCHRRTYYIIKRFSGIKNNFERFIRVGCF